MKRTFQSYLFHFTAPLHISDARLDYGSSARMIHSDTVYAAAISALARTGKLPESVEKSGDLGCTVSSLFPFTTANGQVVYFFPRPLLAVKRKNENIDLAKKIKKVKWIDRTFFEAIINGEEKEIGNTGNDLISGEFLSETRLQGNTILYNQVIPRAKIPRSRSENEGETTIFYMERVLFEKGSGLYMIAEGDTTLLEQGLQILQHEGIGTDRNIGQGTFSLEIGGPFELRFPENNQYAMNLGLFCPQENEVIDLIESKTETEYKGARWDLIKRGGWLTADGYNGIRKKSVYMFSEGSVFNVNQPGVHCAGRVNCNLRPDVTEGLNIPDHPVWRCGRTILFPVISSR